MKKITLATVKSFVKKNSDNLYIKVKSDFDGMSDCVQQVESNFSLVVLSDKNVEQTLGIEGAWFVGQSRDYFKEWSDETYVGYYIFNSCGSFILAVKK